MKIKKSIKIRKSIFKRITVFTLAFLIITLIDFPGGKLTANAGTQYTGYVYFFNPATGVGLIKSMSPNRVEDEALQIVVQPGEWNGKQGTISLYQTVTFNKGNNGRTYVASNVNLISLEQWKTMEYQESEYMPNINTRIGVSGTTEVGKTVTFNSSGLNDNDVFQGWYSTDSNNYQDSSVYSQAKSLSKDRSYTITNGDVGKYLFAKIESKNYNVTMITTTGFNSVVTKSRKAITNDMIHGIPDQYYTGSAVTLNNSSLIVKDGATTLVEGTDYDVAYSGNVNPGTAKAIVTGKDNYNGTGSADFKIKYYDGAVTPLYNSSDSKKDCYPGDVTITADGFSISDSLSGTYSSSYTITGEGSNITKTLYFKQAGTGYITEGKILNVSIDRTAPTGSIALGYKLWDGLSSPLVLRHFKTKDKSVTISAQDSSSKLVDTNGILYAIVTGDTQYMTVEELTEAEAKGTVTWTAYNSASKPTVPTNKKSVIYTKFTDKSGNVAYLSSEGIILDDKAPELTGASSVTQELGDTSATVNYKVDEAANVYLVAVPATDKTVYSAADLIATCDSTAAIAAGGTAISGASISVTNVTQEQAGSTVKQTISGLTPNTAYTVFITAVDRVIDMDATSNEATPVYTGNVTAPQSLSLTTLSKQKATCPASYYGVQKRTTNGNKDIRLIAIIKTLDVDEVGFVYSESDKEPAIDKALCTPLSTKKVYSSIKANGGTKKAEDLGGPGAYYILGTVKDITKIQSDTLYIRVYVKKGDVVSYTDVKALSLTNLK